MSQTLIFDAVFVIKKPANQDISCLEAYTFGYKIAAKKSGLNPDAYLIFTKCPIKKIQIICSNNCIIESFNIIKKKIISYLNKARKRVHFFKKKFKSPDFGWNLFLKFSFF